MALQQHTQPCGVGSNSMVPFKPYVCCVQPACPVVCCSLQDAVALIKDVAEADKAAERLVHEAYQRGSNDNISCVVLKFKF